MLNAEDLDKSQYLLYAWRRQDSDKEVKIGKSTAGRLYGRIITAQTDNPYNIVFLGVQLVDARNDYEMRNYENSVLRNFQRTRAGSEWVYFTDDVREWVEKECIPVDFNDFRTFHRDKTRELRKKPDFVEMERVKTIERRAKEKAAKETGLPEVLASVTIKKPKRKTQGLFRKRDE